MRKLRIGQIIALTSDEKVQDIVSIDAHAHLCFCNMFAMIDRTCKKAAEHHGPNPAEEAHTEVLLLWDKFEKLLLAHGVTPAYHELVSGSPEEVSPPSA